MAIIIKDRVKQFSTTLGSGQLTLSTVPNGYVGFSEVFASGDTTYYCIENRNEFEIGLGTYGVGGANTLSRDTVLNSSTGASLALSGRSTIFVTVPAARFPFVGESGELNLALTTLNDVGLTAPASGQSLVYNGSSWANTTITGYTTEEAQDAIGGILADTSSISFSYNDGAPSIAASVRSSGITDVMISGGIDATKIGSGSVSSTEFGYLDGVTSSLQVQLDSKYASANPSGYISAASVASGYQPLDADLTSLAAASSSGIYQRSGGNWTPVVIGSGLSLGSGTLSNTLDLSSYLTSSVATATYLPLAGGTLTGDLKFTDATYDIGKSGATRPRDGFFSRDITVGTTANINSITLGSVAQGFVSMSVGTSYLNLQGPTTIWGSLSVGTGWGSFSASNGGGIVIGVTDSTGTVHQRAGVTAQTYRVYETYSSSTSFGTLQIKANAGAAYQIGSAVGSAGGTNRAIDFGHWNAAGTWNPSLIVGIPGGPYADAHLIHQSPDTVRGLYVDQYSADAVGPATVWRKARGTFSSPATIQSGDPLGFFGFRGYTSAGSFPTTSSVYIQAVATQGFTGTATGAKLEFATTPNNSTTSAVRLTIDQDGVSTFAGHVTLTQPVSTSGSPTALTLTGAAHTTLALSTEATDVNFNLSRTVQFATGALTTQRAVRIQAPTYSFVGASTITTASTLSISGPPVAGTNATITNAYALEIPTGRIGFTGGANTGGIYFAGAGTYYAPHIHANGELVMSCNPKVSWIFSNTQYMEFYNGIISTSNFIHLGGATYGTGDINIIRDSAGVLATRNGTNAQSFGVYGTWTSTTSYERVNVRGKASANFEIGPENGSAGGTLRGLTLGCYPAGTATIVGWAQFQPNASTGSIEAFYLGPIADSTTTGGNARGLCSIDLTFSQNRVSAAAVASGTNSVLIGGSRGTASGVNSVSIGGSTCAVTGSGAVGIGGTNLTISGTYAASIGGEVCTASSNYAFTGGGTQNTASNQGTSVVGGLNATADRYGMEARASGRFAANGDAQYCKFTLRRKTTDATPVTLMLDGSSTRLTIPSGKIMFCDILISGIKSDGSASACYKRKVAIKNVAGTTALVGTVEAIGTDIEDNVLTDVAITADNTNDALDISVTGISGETWRWVCVVEGLEIAYGT